jgi:hypothetical protein
VISWPSLCPISEDDAKRRGYAQLVGEGSGMSEVLSVTIRTVTGLLQPVSAGGAAMDEGQTAIKKTLPCGSASSTDRNHVVVVRLPFTT